MTQLQLCGVAATFFLLFGACIAYFLRMPVVQPIVQPVPNTKSGSGRDVYLGRGYQHPEPLASWYLMATVDAERMTKHQCLRCCSEYLDQYEIRTREDVDFNVAYFVDPRRGDRSENDNNVAWASQCAMNLLLNGAGAGLLSYDEAWSRIRLIAENVRLQYADLGAFYRDAMFHRRVYLEVPTDGSADPSSLGPRVAMMDCYLAGQVPMPADWNAPLHTNPRRPVVLVALHVDGAAG